MSQVVLNVILLNIVLFYFHKQTWLSGLSTEIIEMKTNSNQFLFLLPLGSLVSTTQLQKL